MKNPSLKVTCVSLSSTVTSNNAILGIVAQGYLDDGSFGHGCTNLLSQEKVLLTD